MPDVSKWRSASAYDYLDTLDTAGLAWEALRRNGDYQRDWADNLSPIAERSRRDDLCRRRWGLRFRDRSRSFFSGCALLLVA